MINTPVIIISDYHLLLSNTVFDCDEVIYSLVIDSEICFGKLTHSFIHSPRITANQLNSFSICFDFSKETNFFAGNILDFKELILQYFFHPNYKIVYNKPLVCFNSIDIELPVIQKLITELGRYVISQGYAGLEIVSLSAKNGDAKDSIFFNRWFPSAIISSTYHNLLVKNYYCARYMGIDLEKANETMQILIETEKNLLKENSVYFNHLREFQQLKQDFLIVCEKLALTAEDLSNQKQYLKIYKDQDESIKINEFYHNEYEVLPLWYKKIGHIIKVITGKRAFRSLFDNNIKKYKN